MIKLSHTPVSMLVSGLAALQGAIFAVNRAAVDRSTAAGTRKPTGVWPGVGAQRCWEEA